MFHLYLWLLFVSMSSRKIPGIPTYTEEQSEKDQEVIPTVTSIAVPNPEGEMGATAMEHADIQAEPQGRGIVLQPFPQDSLLYVYMPNMENNNSACILEASGHTPRHETATNNWVYSQKSHILK